MRKQDELKALKEIGSIMIETLSENYKEFLDTTLNMALQLPFDEMGKVILTDEFRSDYNKRCDSIEYKLRPTRNKGLEKLSDNEIENRINALILKAHGN